MSDEDRDGSFTRDQQLTLAIYFGAAFLLVGTANLPGVVDHGVGPGLLMVLGAGLQVVGLFARSTSD